MRLLASSRSAGKKIQFGGREIEVEKLSEDSVAGCHFVFISATDEISKLYAPFAAKAGAVVIDDLTTPNGIAYWVVGDNLRKVAALNALQIAELMISRGLI